jgi:4-hydroxy-tetrahydrodipicolinate synthase
VATHPDARSTVLEALHGALPALVSPLTPDRELDEEDVVATVTRALDDGATGVLVAGSTGEGTLLEPDQRAHLVDVAREATDGHVTAGATPPLVLAGACGSTVAALDADVARLASAGADAVLVLAPSTYPLSPDELVDLHRGVADRAAVPTLVYHVPQFTGSTLTAETVRELAGHPNVVGVKDSSPDADRRATFVAAVQDVDGFDVVTGHAPSLRQALEAGATGSITAVACLRQRHVVALHAAVGAADGAAATRAQRTLTRMSDGLDAVGTSLPAAVKAALQLEGVIKERWCRPPLRSVPGPRLDQVRTALMP